MSENKIFNPGDPIDWDGMAEDMARRDDENYNGVLVEVDRLLTVADDPAADGDEAAAAWKQAQKIMNKFARLDYYLHEDGRFPLVQHWIKLSPDPVMNGMKSLLAGVVALGNRCSAWYSYTGTDDNPSIDAIVFYGVENDCIRAERIWAGMEERRAADWRSAARQYHKKADEKWRNGYYMGFVERISDRYKRLNREWTRQGWRGSEEELEAANQARAGADVLRTFRDIELEEFEIKKGLKKRSIEKEDALAWTGSRRAEYKGRKDANGISLGLDVAPTKGDGK